MPELAVPHPRPRRPPPWSAPAGPVRPRPWSARPLPPRPPAAPTSALRQRFRPGHGFSPGRPEDQSARPDREREPAARPRRDFQSQWAHL